MGRQCRRRSVEKERFLQARWCIEHEAQEETRSSSSQGREPLHERAVRLQSKASKQDGPGFADEETQGDDQLRRAGGVAVAAAHSSGPRWADSPGPDLSSCTFYQRALKQPRKK